MSVEINPAALRQEMAYRGWAQDDLARHAGLSSSTVWAALKGERISSKSVYKIGLALELHKPAEPLKGLVAS